MTGAALGIPFAGELLLVCSIALSIAVLHEARSNHFNGVDVSLICMLGVLYLALLLPAIDSFVRSQRPTGLVSMKFALLSLICYELLFDVVFVSTRYGDGFKWRHYAWEVIAYAVLVLNIFLLLIVPKVKAPSRPFQLGCSLSDNAVPIRRGFRRTFWIPYVICSSARCRVARCIRWLATSTVILRLCGVVGCAESKTTLCA